MAFFGLAIKAGLKGLGGIFKGVGKAVKKFREKRKRQAKDFKEDILSNPMGMGQFSQWKGAGGGGGEMIAPNNPLGVANPSLLQRPLDFNLQGARAPFSGGAPNDSKVISKPLLIGIISGGALLVGLVIYMAGNKKRR